LGEKRSLQTGRKSFTTRGGLRGGGKLSEGRKEGIPSEVAGKEFRCRQTERTVSRELSKLSASKAQKKVSDDLGVREKAKRYGFNINKKVHF